MRGGMILIEKRVINKEIGERKRKKEGERKGEKYIRRGREKKRQCV